MIRIWSRAASPEAPELRKAFAEDMPRERSGSRTDFFLMSTYYCLDLCVFFSGAHDRDGTGAGVG